MSETLTIEQAATRLPELIHALGPKDEIILTENDLIVAKITAEPVKPLKERRLGTLKGALIILKDDDSHLEDFKDYM